MDREPDLHLQHVRLSNAHGTISLTDGMCRDGLRIDSVLEMETSYWTGFNEAAAVYIVGEVDNGDPTVVYPYQQYISGVLDYPA